MKEIKVKLKFEDLKKIKQIDIEEARQYGIMTPESNDVYLFLLKNGSAYEVAYTPNVDGYFGILENDNTNMEDEAIIAGIATKNNGKYATYAQWLCTRYPNEEYPLLLIMMTYDNAELDLGSVLS